MSIFEIDTLEEYLANKDNVDINERKDYSFENALSSALYDENFDKVIWLINEGCCLMEQEDYLEDIYLNCIASKKYLFLSKSRPDIQKLMIDKGIKIDNPMDFYSNNIYLTGYAGNVEILERLLAAGHGIFVYDKNNEMIFNIFFDTDIKSDIFSYLLNKDESFINSKSSKGDNILLKVKDIEEVDILISKGIDINNKNKLGQNILFFISNIEILGYLLEKGIEIPVNEEVELEDRSNKVGFLEALKIENPLGYNVVSAYLEKNRIKKEIQFQSEDKSYQKKRI